MSGTIHLIVEDKTDAEVIRAILKAKSISVRINPLIPTGGTGGISRLAAQLEALIRTALEKRQADDCIAVLHDADEQSQSDRTLYDRIRTVCSSYRQEVALIVAKDEIEAWLLADESLCRWLGERPGNFDNQHKPSARLNQAVKNKTGKDYAARTRVQVLNELDGSGDKHSPSMSRAMTHLNNAPCIQQD